MARRLPDGFDAIKKGQGVDWKTLRARLVKAGASDALIDAAVVATAYGDRYYQVVVRDKDCFERLQDFVRPVNRSSRSAASVAGNSHVTGVNGAILTAWGMDDETPYNYLFMPGRELPRPSRRHALIIENLECFLNKDDTYQFIRQACGVPYPADDIEFIMGAGNSISNRQIVPYLKAFAGEVICLLDVDLGGLKIYANLLSGGLSSDSLHYLVPEDLEQRLALSKRKADEKELEGLSSVYGLSPVTDRVIAAIRYYKRTLEQESYRAPR